MARDLQTSMLNQILASAMEAMDPPMVDRKRLNLMYVTQVAARRRGSAFFSNVDRDIPAHYIRFLETRFRDALVSWAVRCAWSSAKPGAPLSSAVRTRAPELRGARQAA